MKETQVVLLAVLAALVSLAAGTAPSCITSQRIRPCWNLPREYLQAKVGALSGGFVQVQCSGRGYCQQQLNQQIISVPSYERGSYGNNCQPYYRIWNLPRQWGCQVPSIKQTKCCGSCPSYHYSPWDYQCQCCKGLFPYIKTVRCRYFSLLLHLYKTCSCKSFYP